MPPSAEDEGFFGQLARWEGAEPARSAFTRLTAQAPGLAPTQMREGVYRRLVEFLLRRLGLIANFGAPGAEWLPLLRWDAETNAGYFTHRSIDSLFSHWPGLTSAQRTRMEEVVTGWLHLGREGFPARMALLLSAEDLSRWLRLFPSGWLWEAASLLEGLGFSVPVSQCGATSWLRHEEGKFAIPDTPEAMRRWQAACWETPAFRGEGTLEASVHRTNFVAAAFAGRYTALGIKGPCGPLPDCPACPLRHGCRWHAHALEGEPGVAGVLALARSGRLEALGHDHLLQGVFGLSETRRAELQERLNPLSLRRLTGASQEELETALGPGEPGPERLRLLMELGRRLAEEPLLPGAEVRTAWDVFKHFRLRLRDDKQEQLIAVLLDSHRKFIGERMITQGTLDSSPVHPRELFRAAVRESAAGVIIVHNHPSGDPKPSQDDLTVTRQLMDAGEMMGIPVLDHVIIGNDRYVSLNDEGWLDKGALGKTRPPRR